MAVQWSADCRSGDEFAVRDEYPEDPRRRLRARRDVCVWRGDECGGEVDHRAVQFDLLVRFQLDGHAQLCLAAGDQFLPGSRLQRPDVARVYLHQSRIALHRGEQFFFLRLGCARHVTYRPPVLDASQACAFPLLPLGRLRRNPADRHESDQLAFDHSIANAERI